MNYSQLAAIIRAARLDERGPHQHHAHISLNRIELCIQPCVGVLGLARAYFEAIRPLLPPGWELEVTTYHGEDGERAVTFSGRTAPAVEDDGNPPNGCLLCGVEEYGHGQQYKTGTGYHYWINPGDALRKARMLARRARATA
ncbi:hypothetical protein [Nonomuraea candida]|uniref:hypothetical protein n=1 Tax=Nonomuraea candida TaxID=359159 RepID=UPI0005BA69C3|nr:hypothetical protein [Nonomuraea candida]